MPITPYGFKELAIGMAVTAILAVAFVALFRHYHSPWFLAPIVPLGLVFAWMVWFFRDPQRITPGDPGVIVSPADGTVTHIDEADEPDYIGGTARRCSIFLSIFSVHLNRAPANGTVEFVKFRPGAFFDARREESLVKNQNQDIGLATSETGMPSRMVVRQSTGAIARNIVCPVSPGTVLERGQRYGMIKFGSRTTLFLSRDAEVEWLVKAGDPVRAGETVLARIRDSGAASGKDAQ